MGAIDLEKSQRFYTVCRQTELHSYKRRVWLVGVLSLNVIQGTSSVPLGRGI
jgi:hypothetical protein